jgi:glycine C-acetyltransferase/8-amino-7-oxononanoate synthase
VDPIRSLRAALAADVDAVRRASLYRQLRRFDALQQPQVTVDGRRVVMLSSSDVLGLSRHPRVVAAALEATARHGCASGSSRLIAGNHPLYDALETALAEFKGAESALVFSTGYLANIGTIPALVGEGDAVFSDVLNHASIVDGCRLSRARVEIFRHGDPGSLEDALRRAAGARRRLVVVDGVYSMDGDLAPLPDFVDLCDRYDAWLLVDDTHGTGILGERGRGTAEHFGLAGRIPIEVGTLGKSLGSFGAWVTGPHELRDALVNRARGFIFTCALPPAALAAALAGLRVIQEEPEHRRRLLENTNTLREGLRASGFHIGLSPTHILPLFIEDESRVMPFCEALLDAGVFAQGIRSPTVPPGTSRLRLCAMATHSKVQLDRAIEAFDRVGRRMGILR